MKYYKLSYDYENDDDYVNCNVGVIGDIDEYSVSCGNYINDWSEVRFKYNSEEGMFYQITKPMCIGGWLYQKNLEN